MKRGLVMLLLVASHLAVFAVARRGGEGGVEAGSVEPAGEPGMAPAKVSEREESGYSHRRCLEDLVESDLNRADFVAARRELFRDWIKRDLLGAMDELFAPEKWGRYGPLAKGLEHVIEEEMARQPREVWDWIKRRPGGDMAFEWWKSAMEAHGDTALMLDLLPEAPAFATRGTMWLACEDATREQLATIRGLLEGKLAAKEGRDRLDGDVEAMVSLYADRVVDLAGEEMGAALAGESNPAVRKEILSDWAGAKVAQQPAGAAVAELLRLPQEFQKEALQQVANWGWGGGYASAAGLIEEADRHALFDSFTAEERAEWLGDKMGTLREDYISLERALRDISVIRRDPMRREVLKQLGADYGDADGFQGKVAELPSGPDRDALVAGAMEEMSAGNDEFTALLPLLGDPAVRKKFELLLEEEMREEEE